MEQPTPPDSASTPSAADRKKRALPAPSPAERRRSLEAPSPVPTPAPPTPKPVPASVPVTPVPAPGGAAESAVEENAQTSHGQGDAASIIQEKIPSTTATADAEAAPAAAPVEEQKAESEAPSSIKAKSGAPATSLVAVLQTTQGNRVLEAKLAMVEAKMALAQARNGEGSRGRESPQLAARSETELMADIKEGDQFLAAIRDARQSKARAEEPEWMKQVTAARVARASTPTPKEAPRELGELES